MNKKTCFIFVLSLVIPFGGSLEADGNKNLIRVKGIIYDLQHPDSNRRKQAAMLSAKDELLQEVGEAVPALILATEDTSLEVRLEATRALVKINDARAIEAFTRLTRDMDKDIQRESIAGIVNIHVAKNSGFIHGIKRVVGFFNLLSDDYNPMMVEPYVSVSEDVIVALSELLASPKTEIRQEAAVALGILRGHSALPAIERSLRLEIKDSVKVELIRSIYKIGDPGGSLSLIPLVHDRDKKVRDEAILTLGILRVSQAVPSLKTLYESGVEERKKVFGFFPVSGNDNLEKKLLEALAYIGDMSCEGLFISAVKDSRNIYRRFGAEGLGRSGNFLYTTEVAKSYHRESSENVRLAMSYALFRMGREAHLVELVANIHKDQVFHYLLELAPGDIEKLYPYVSTEKDSVKVHLLNLFGQRGGQSSIPIIEEMMNDENDGVVSAANLALRRIRARVAS